MDTVEFQRLLDFPDLVITSLWYSGAGYKICDQAASSIIMQQLYSSETGVMKSLKTWRKALRKEYYSGGSNWPTAGRDISYLNNHPIREFFSHQDDKMDRMVATLCETRSTALATSSLEKEKISDFIRVVTDGNIPPRREIFDDTPDIRVHRYPAISVSGSATYEFSRKKRGRFGHILSLLDTNIDKIIDGYDCYGPVGPLRVKSCLIDETKPILEWVKLGGVSLPNFFGSNFSRVVFSLCYREYLFKRRKSPFVWGKLLTIKERGKARILICAEAAFGQLQFPFSKMVASALEELPETRNGLRGTDDAFRAFQEFPMGEENYSFILSDLTESTDSPPFWVVSEFLKLCRNKGLISPWYHDLLQDIGTRQIRICLKDGTKFTTVRGIPMGNPITKSILTYMTYNIVRRSLVETFHDTRIRFWFRVKGDDLLVALFGSDGRIPVGPVEGLRAIQSRMESYGFRLSESDTFISRRLAFFCEASFRVPKLEDSYIVVTQKKVTGSFIDPVKGRFLLPLFKVDTFKPRSLGDLPVSKVIQLNNVKRYFREGSFEDLLLRDQISLQQVTYRINHLRDFWYPFPTQCGGLGGFISPKPPTKWRENQEDWFYWVWYYLYHREGANKFVPKEVIEVVDNTFRRESDHGYSGVHVSSKINFEDYGYKPIWTSNDEAKYQTLLLPDLSRHPDCVSEETLTSRILSYSSLLDCEVDRFESKLVHYDRVKLTPFPPHLKGMVWEIYLSQPLKSFQKPWKFYDRDSIPFIAPLQMRGEAPIMEPDDPRLVIKNLRDNPLAEIPNEDWDRKVIRSILDSLSESKDQRNWCWLNTRDFKIVEHFYPVLDKFSNKSLLILQSSYQFGYDELSRLGCLKTPRLGQFLHSIMDGFEKHLKSQGCTYTAWAIWLITQKGVRRIYSNPPPDQRRILGQRFSPLGNFVDYTNQQWQILDSGFSPSELYRMGKYERSIQVAKPIYPFGRYTRQFVSSLPE